MAEGGAFVCYSRKRRSFRHSNIPSAFSSTQSNPNPELIPANTTSIVPNSSPKFGLKFCSLQSNQNSSPNAKRKLKANACEEGMNRLENNLTVSTNFKEEKDCEVAESKKLRKRSFPRKRRLKPQAETSVRDIEDIEDSLKEVTDFSEKEACKIAECLLEWYDVNKRQLPWRGNHSDKQVKAYAVWVSEVMLQQTRVSAVINYYNQWMEKWPTVQHLAQASQEEVNQIWAGLGYYRRARYLLEGAKEIVERKGGVIPSTVADLKTVCGIGNYTAGAVASIVFQRVVPVVDGNVIRVLCRLKAISANPKSSATVKRLWELASQLVDQKRPGDFNQALMELGATVCTVSNPLCSSCPVSGNCKAFSMVKSFNLGNEETCLQKGKLTTMIGPSVTDYPLKVSKPRPREECAAVCVVEIISKNDNGHKFVDDERNLFLLVKRPKQGLLAGLWEFPSVLLHSSDASIIERKEAINKFLKTSFGIHLNAENNNVILRKSVGEYTHVFSHIRLQMHIEWMVIHSTESLHGIKTTTYENAVTCKWVDMKTIRSMGLTSGVKKVYMMVKECRENHSICEVMKKVKKI